MIVFPVCGMWYVQIVSNLNDGVRYSSGDAQNSELAFLKLTPYFLLKESPCYRLMNKSHNIRINLCRKFSPLATLLIDSGEE